MKNLKVQTFVSRMAKSQREYIFKPIGLRHSWKKQQSTVHLHDFLKLASHLASNLDALLEIFSYKKSGEHFFLL